MKIKNNFKTIAASLALLLSSGGQFNVQASSQSAEIEVFAEEAYLYGLQLIIYIQTEKPGDSNQIKNWLPAPEGSFRFTARFYHPKMNIIDGSYKMPKPVKTN